MTQPFLLALANYLPEPYGGYFALASHLLGPDRGCFPARLDMGDNANPIVYAAYYAAKLIDSGDVECARAYFAEASRLVTAGRPGDQILVALRERRRIIEEEKEIACARSRLAATLRKRAPLFKAVRRLRFRVQPAELAAFLNYAEERQLPPDEIVMGMVRIERRARDDANLARRNRAKMAKVAFIDEQMKPLEDQAAALEDQIAVLKDQKAKLMAEAISPP